MLLFVRQLLSKISHAIEPPESMFYCKAVLHNNSISRIYRQTFNISVTLVGNKIVDHSDEVGASPVGAAPTTS